MDVKHHVYILTCLLAPSLIIMPFDLSGRGAPCLQNTCLLRQNTCLSRQNTSFVETKLCRDMLFFSFFFVATNIIFSRQADFYRDKHVFVATKHVFCRDKHTFVATNVFVATNICRHITFVATKMILVAGPANDSRQARQLQCLAALVRQRQPCNRPTGGTRPRDSCRQRQRVRQL